MLIGDIGGERHVDGMFMVVDWLNIMAIVKLVIKLAVKLVSAVVHDFRP